MRVSSSAIRKMAMRSVFYAPFRTLSLLYLNLFQNSVRNCCLSTMDNPNDLSEEKDKFNVIPFYNFYIYTY